MNYSNALKISSLKRCSALTHSVEIKGILSRIFWKNFVKVTVLLNKLLKSWFDEIFFGEREFLVFPHCGTV